MSIPVENVQINVYAKSPETLALFYRGFGFEETFRFPPGGSPEPLELKRVQFTLGFTSRDALQRGVGFVIEEGLPRGAP